MASSSQVTPAKVKKRKSTAAVEMSEASGQFDLRIVLGESSSSAGPVFVNFPSVRPVKSTPFTLYTRDIESDADLAKQRTLIAGETEDVDFFSTNRGGLGNGEGSDCQYLPALYDPSTSTLHIQPSAPLYLLAHRVKRLRTAPLSSQPAPGRTEYRAKRNDLGEVFGTKKAKSQIKAEERNRVDASAMQGVKGHLMESIGEREVVEEGPQPPPESIPIPDLETSQVNEVYPLDSFIPPDEFGAISVSELMKAADDRARSALLPYRKSRWVEGKIKEVIKGPQAVRKTKLKIAYYLSLLQYFLAIARTISETAPTDLPRKFASVPPQLLNGLLTRFAERSGKKYVVTEKMRTKVLAWICVGYLWLDGWSVEVGKAARDLGMPEQRIATMFKSLGCSIDLPSPGDRERLKLTLSDAQKVKRAVLHAPVKFPKTKRRGPVQR